MVYIVYRNYDKKAIKIQENTPTSLSDDLSYVERKDFNLNDLETYNIYVKSEDNILSIEKADSEKETIRLKKENKTLHQQLFQSQTELLQTQLEKSDLEQRLFNLETQLLSKGVIE